MSTSPSIERTLYQWQTRTGAPVREFFSESAAITWMDTQKELKKHAAFYASLQLVQIHITITRKVIIPVKD